jgi:hypothetical protein
LDLDTLSRLGEFIGGSAVLVSLIYLAIQIRQGNRQVEHNSKSLEIAKRCPHALHAVGPVEVRELIPMGPPS